MDSALFAAVGLFVSILAGGQDAAPREGLSPEKEAYLWFDTLGFPDLRKRSFVKVATGWSTLFADGKAENFYLRGFLLEDKKGKFTVLTEDLAIMTFERSPPGSKEHEKVAFEVIDLAKEALDFADLALKDPDKVRDAFRSPNLELPAKLFLFARACERNGFAPAAQKVYEAAAKSGRNRSYTGESRRARPKDSDAGDREWDNGRPRTLREALAVQIGHIVFWRAILQFQDPQKTRKDLLDTLRPFAERFPESEHAATALELVPVLERMVREDEEKLEASSGQRMVVKIRLVKPQETR